jgi:hypothetical protein
MLGIDFPIQADIGERWFGDGAPYWREGRLDLASMTSGEARQQRRRDVKMLRRHAKADPAALALACTMEACRPEQRCGACAECKRARQRAFVAAGARVLSRGSLKVMALSVVLAYQAVRVGHLGDPEQLFGELSRIARRALRAAHIPWALGGFDVSVNEHRDRRFQPHYRPHIWMFVPRFAFERGERVFRSFFPISANVRRPVVANPFDGDLRALAYALKPNFTRRVTLPADGAVARRNTRGRPLRAAQKLELAMALDARGPTSRIFVHGARLVVSKGEFRFVREAHLPARQFPRRVSAPALGLAPGAVRDARVRSLGVPRSRPIDRPRQR